MPFIKKLSPEVASRIAAGEVVERPFNAVKELIENSADAGATKISVEIAEGGLSLIRVTDDGKGIPQEDLSLALERFATSKASSVEEVYAASTFGFRGEALAAISAVSDFTLRSGTSSGRAFEIRSVFGEKGEVKPCASVTGTMTEALNLFENLPARRKFLKSDKSLENEVSKLVKHFSLVNPSVEISLIINGKEVYQAFSGENVAVRAAKVFPGKAFFMGKIEYCGASASVAATLPAASDRIRRDGIVIGVNGRLIKDQALVQAVIQAYHRLIPDGRYPAVAVDIRLNPEEVDSNVHPAKLEVRFEKPRDVFALVTDAVKKSFEGRGINIDYSERINVNGIKFNEFVDSALSPFAGRSSRLGQTEEPEEKEPLNAKGAALSLRHEPLSRKAAATADYIFSIPEKLSGDEEEYGPGDCSLGEDTGKKAAVGEFRVVGQIDNTYIVCETENKEILFIDQHAAHERILFEKFRGRESEGAKASAVLPVPLKAGLTEELAEAALEMKETFMSFGYGFRRTGKDLEITKVPYSALRRDIEAEFTAIALDLAGGGLSKTQDAPRAMLSCKSAVKAGDSLDKAEMEYLLSLLFNTDNFGTCPHGRPIVYVMSVSELSRKFLR